MSRGIEHLIKRIAVACLVCISLLTFNFIQHASALPGDRGTSFSGVQKNDPCDHLPDPQGKARGINKKCPVGGSSSGIARGDFNNDGFADVAIGVPFKNTPSTVGNSGAVIVIYGSSTGLLPAGGSGVPVSQFWSQNTSEVPDTSEAGDKFGAALAAGDFNDDGFSDLAIGVPEDKVVRDGVSNHGQVTAIYGSPVGLSTNPDTRVRTAQRFVAADVNDGQMLTFAAETEADVGLNQSFGSALAWGDFDGDGVGDLAIGLPLAGIGQPSAVGSAGGVGVLYGVPAAGTDPGGLSTANSQFWTQNSSGVEDSVEAGDRFGARLAAGDFNGDDRSDLAIGIPLEDLFDVDNAGAVEVLFGSENRLTSS